MARKRMSRATALKNPSRKRFAKAAKTANEMCHRTTNSFSSFKSCMSREMKAGMKSSKRR